MNFFTSAMGFSSSPLEAKQALGLSNAVPSALRSGSPMLSSTFVPQFSLRKVIEQWKGKEIARWIEGLGDQMNPYLGMIRNSLKSGKQLEALDDDSLKKIGISALGARKTILQAISLLMYMCHESEKECLQRLAHSVKMACIYLENTMSGAIRMREKAIRRSDIVNILNSVSNAVLEVAEKTKRLVFWLDRTPFDEIQTYIDARNSISSIMWNLLRNVNVQPKALFETGQQIIKMAVDLGAECQKIIGSQDPLILYASFIETAVLKRASNDINWGLNIQSSYRGVHVISDIMEGSPADACTKVDAGDEILIINGRTVVGWDLTTVAQRIGVTDATQLTLIMKRRPRDLRLNKQSKLTTRAVAPSSQAYSAEEADPFENSQFLPIKRHRSCHVISEIVKENEKRLRDQVNRRTLRRSSIASSSPRRELRKSGSEDLARQDDIDGEEEALVPRIARRARTMRHQPDGYVRSFIDNKLVCDIEDDVICDQLTHNVKCPGEFAQIREVEKDELDRLNVPRAKISDDEWKAPYREFAGSRRGIRADSSMSGVLDSPRSMIVSSRMTSSVDDSSAPFGGVMASPSSSSMNSVSSPAPKSAAAIMTSSLTEWPLTSDDLPGSPGTAAYSGMEKLFEGWVKRRKTKAELSTNEVTNKWPKCWMCLRGYYLLLYTNQYTKRPDIVINLIKANISDSTDLKTSKKNIFRITCPPLDYHFSCLTNIDWKNWTQKMKMAKEIYTHQPRMMSQSISSYTNDTNADGSSSVMSQSQYEGYRSSPSSTLPRANGMSTSKSSTLTTRR